MNVRSNQLIRMSYIVYGISKEILAEGGLRLRRNFMRYTTYYIRYVPHKEKDRLYKPVLFFV